MNDFADVWASAATVPGWLTEAQGAQLARAAAACPATGRIVEIGSFRGRSTIVLASSAPAGAEVIAIDPHAGNDRGPRQLSGFGAEAAADRAAFLGHLRDAGIADRVHHVATRSDEALGLVSGRTGGDVDVLFVDGAHRFGAARADLRDWGARVVPGGTMLVHDAFSSVGVTLALLAQVVGGTRWRYAGRTGSLAVYHADLERGRARNTVRQLAELGWFARNVALKVALTAGLGRATRRLGRGAPAWPY